MRVIIVPTSKSSYNDLLSYLQRAWHSAWHTPSIWCITNICYCCLDDYTSGHWRAQGSSRKVTWEHLLMACCGMAFPPYAFLSWVDSSFSEASRVVLRPFHILRYSSWELLGKIYLPSPYPTESQGNYSHWPCQARDRPGKLSLDLSLQLTAHNPFLPEARSPEIGDTQVSRKGPSQYLAQVWTSRVWV